MLGVETGEIVRMCMVAARVLLRDNLVIHLAGYSRGGAVAIAVAQQIHTEFPNAKIPVMAPFDAVDRDRCLGDLQTIPGNVEQVLHANARPLLHFAFGVPTLKLRQAMSSKWLLRIFLSFVLVHSFNAASAGDGQSKVLAAIPAMSQGLRYELSVGACARGECPILVHLVGEQGELDVQTLSLKAPSSHFHQRKFQRGNGAGDPLAEDAEMITVSFGDGEDAVTLVARPIKLTASLNGIVIDERFGFEEIKRDHWAFAALDGKLRKVWSAEEGDGPTFSTTAVVNLPDGRQRLVYFSVFNSPDTHEPDKLSVKALVFDGGRRQFVADRTALIGFVWGPYESVSAAREVRSQLRTCRLPLWVLPANNFPEVHHVGFVIATVSSSEEEVTRASVVLKSCSDKAPFVPFRTEQESLVLW